MVRQPLPEVWIAANTTWNLFNFRKGLIHALVDAGYRVTAFAPEDRYVSQVLQLGVRHVHLPLDNIGTNPAKEFATVFTVLRILRTNRPTVLLTFTPKPNIYGSLAAAPLGIPVIANIAGLGRAFMESSGWLTRISRMLYFIALRHPHKIFFQNREDMELFVSTKLVNPKRVGLLPGSGVDTRRFRPRQKKPRGQFVFLFVGRLLADKGVREFVQAARMLQAEGERLECQVLGFIDNGNPSAIGERELAQWQAEGVIRYLGGADDVVTALEQADCVVLPSYYREGCPRTLLEAASMGIPLIAADTTGCREIVVDGENGLLCSPRDAVDLAAKMKLMIQAGPQVRAEMGRRGRIRMEQEFDEQFVIGKYLDAVSQLVAA